MYKTAEGKDFEQAVALILTGSKPLEGPVRLVLHLFHSNRRRDIDSALKILLDSLEGVAYVNDNQIFELIVRKDFDKQDPRVVVEVSEIKD